MIRLKYVRLADNVSIKMGKLEPREYFGRASSVTLGPRRPDDKVVLTLDEPTGRVHIECGDDHKSVHESQTKFIAYFAEGELEALTALEAEEDAKRAEADAKTAAQSPKAKRGQAA